MRPEGFALPLGRTGNGTSRPTGPLVSLTRAVGEAEGATLRAANQPSHRVSVMPQSLRPRSRPSGVQHEEPCLPVLVPEIRSELHLGTSAVVLNNDGCPSLRVGGVEDHVHLLFALSRTRTISQVVENVKTSSSKWLKTKKIAALIEFHWQNGYGVFSVSVSRAPTGAIDYILRQEEHHQAQTFRQELRRFFEQDQVAYDERYVWD